MPSSLSRCQPVLVFFEHGRIEAVLFEVAGKLPDEVIEATRAKYVEAYERLTGRTFSVDGAQG